MSTRALFSATFLAATTAAALGQSIATVDWNDPAVVAAKAGTLVGSGSGFESVGTSKVLDLELPVVGVLASDLAKVFGESSAGLEASSDGTDPPLDLKQVRPKVVVHDDNKEYDIWYDITEDVAMRIRGTRLIASSADEIEAVPDISLADLDDEVWESEIQYNRFGEVLYSAGFVCNDIDVISYCQSETLLQRAVEQSRVLFAGVQK